MNNDVIKLLPDSVANQIAAGEVIQRPASVVKELVENAVDAGATRIEIILKDAGRTLVQVVDNGCGMSMTDARLAFERHSTSKITSAADLLSLHTMGFRGEALASIAAISQIELRTARRTDTVGTRILISGSAVESQEPEACAPGSNMMVKNLFFNVPARRKFLKKDSIELAHILHEFERLALVNCNIEFIISHNGVVLHQLLPGTMHKRICELFGKQLEKQLMPVSTDTSIVRVEGFVATPEAARKRGFHQYLMVNGRNMRHPYFQKAVASCYEQLIPVDCQPSYFLSFSVDPETIDVNIHPQKHEIKFENEQPIRQILVAAVRETLGRFNAVPSIDFDQEDMPDIPVFAPDSTRRPEISVDPTYNPFNEPSTPRPSSSGLEDWDTLYANFARSREEGLSEVRPSALNSMDLSSLDFETPASEVITPSLPVEEVSEASAVAPFQLKGRYILTGAKAGLLIVDQHRAQVRVLFDRYLALAQAGQLTMQRIMFPEIVNLSVAQSALMNTLAPRLGELGFDVTYLGDTSWAVNGLPSELDGVAAGVLIEALVEGADDEGSDLKEISDQRIALAMARERAVKPGQILSTEEMDKILADLFSITTPTYTPDGKLVMTVMPIEDIAALFN